MNGWARVVRGAELATLVMTAAFAILLFVNEPAKPAPVPKVGTANAGSAIFASRCASCHASDGSGGFGPALGNGVSVGRFPNAADQIAVVKGGRGSMPSFAGSLTDEQIAAVVAFTRDELGR
ncbi:MAG TPA: cytochrome c [Acidimicrobiales bacterium]